MSPPAYSEKNAHLVSTVLSRQAAHLKKAGQRVVNSRQNDHVVVMVEPREHPLLEGVLRNIMHFVNAGQTGWNLHVFCGSANEAFIRARLPGWDVRITNMGVDNLTADRYNKLLLQAPFWEAIAEENILVVQTDTMMFRGLPASMLSYDFVGAIYVNPHEKTPKGLGCNGGFSFRKKSAILDCLHRISIADIEEYRQVAGKSRLPSLQHCNQIAEDVFMNHAFEMCGKKLPDEVAACRFATEAVYCRESVWIHAPEKEFFAHAKLVDMVRASELAQYLD